MDTFDLEHNPRTKLQIKDLLYNLLYAPVLRSYHERLKRLILKNCKLVSHAHPSLIYRGEIYIADGAPRPRSRRVAMLHESLSAEMDEYLKESAYLNSHELPYVLGYINQVLNISNDLPDYLKLLPESVHQPLIQLMTTCPCRTSTLAPSEVDALRAENTIPINLMKQRLTLNLLL